MATAEALVVIVCMTVYVFLVRRLHKMWEIRPSVMLKKIKEEKENEHRK